MPRAPEISSESNQPPQPNSRRRFLRRFALAGAAGASVLLAGCGGDGERDGQTGPAASTDSAGAASTNGTNRCVAPSALSEAAKSGRQKYEYVAQSPHPQKQCDNCQFWVAAEAGKTCGGCRLFPGPVHPEGYCTAWLRA